MAPPESPDGLREALDNMIRHHNATRVGNASHVRPDRCEFVEQALAALRSAPPESPDGLRERIVVEIENEGVVTWGDDGHRARFLAAPPESPDGL